MSGASWGAMVDYQQYTGDTSYFNVTYTALVSQISETDNYLPVSEKFDEGNDDVAFWAFSAMSAAEYGWPEPPAPYPTWAGVCENVFNDFVARWKFADDTCGGGLKWQIFSSSAGYNYKNSISNGGFFQLAARLYRFTGNETYYEWARDVWNWSTELGFIADSGDGYVVYDGASDTLNCSEFDHTMWSYNLGVFMMGTAVLANISTNPDNHNWTQQTLGFVEGVHNFISPFPNATDIMYEQACATSWSCNVDQYSFKAYLSRWLAQTSILVPSTAERIHQILRTSANAAVKCCVDGTNGQVCGARWYLQDWDGTSGVGQSLSVLEVIYNLLVR